MTEELPENRTRFESAEIEGLLKELTTIRQDIVANRALPRVHLEAVHANYRDSARNLLHYLALRRHDLRPIQVRLAALGLSSLGRAESFVLDTVDAVLDVLHRLAQRPLPAPNKEGENIDFAKGRRLLAEHTEALLGSPPPGREVRIMVTMPSEAANENSLVHDLLKQGMNCMRINCAHDDSLMWSRMVENLRRAERTLGHSCRVVMDLAGPKLRTGPLEPGPSVIRIRPRRDEYGQVTTPARIWLSGESSPVLPPISPDAVLPVSAIWVGRLRVGDRVKLTDARGSRRTWTVIDVAEKGCLLESAKTAYLTPGTLLRHEGETANGTDRETPVLALPPKEASLTLHAGDLLVLTRDLVPGRQAIRDSEGRVLTPPRIGCTIPEVFENVRAGESIWFDDGKIGGVIEKVENSQVLVRITQTFLGGGKLRADKGINLPESRLKLEAMTAKDIEDLTFVVQHADIIELSFPKNARDVELLQEHLKRLGSRQPGLVLKIETRQGFECLPEMLLKAMQWPCCGVMIARGDLAVECGFERLAEVQEEILWICEAAHIPVIWATQVLESLTKTGMPSRAEITDAAMGHRAECVMLNKGPHVLSAVRVLDNILRRMQAHQAKKRAMLRELRLAHGLSAGASLATDLGNPPTFLPRDR